ncbi:UNVERIFIED_CONTAM: hypothetical protein NCL1_49529 [Trichonephila clavipes]
MNFSEQWTMTGPLQKAHRATDAVIKCIKEKSEGRVQDTEVDCDGKNILVGVKYVFAVKYPKKSVDCAVTAAETLDKKLTEEEKELIDKLKERAKTIYDRVLNGTNTS